MSCYFDDKDKKYPDLVMKILDYFEISNKTYGTINDKSVFQFCSIFSGDNKEVIYQPSIVNRICKRLCECGQLERIGGYGRSGLQDNYLYIIRDKDYYYREKTRLKYYFNCMVYGFEYIYEMYRNLVVPLVWEKDNGDYAVGTGFKYLNGIVTAKHCLEDVSNLQIRGYSAKDLSKSSIYISDKFLIL